MKVIVTIKEMFPNTNIIKQKVRGAEEKWEGRKKCITL